MTIKTNDNILLSKTSLNSFGPSGVLPVGLALCLMIPLSGCKVAKMAGESNRSAATANATPQDGNSEKPNSVLFGADIGTPSDGDDEKPISSPISNPIPAPVPRLPVIGPIMIVGADAGAGPHLKVFALNPLREAFSRFVFDEAFRGGVRVAAGDLDSDGSGEIVAGSGPGATHVKVFKVHRNALQETASFKPFGELRSGVYVAACELAGKPAIVVSAGEGAPPHIKAFRPSDLQKPFLSFYAFDQSFLGGVRVACAKDLIVAGAGPGATPQVATFNAAGQAISKFLAFDDGFKGGVYVGVRRINAPGTPERFGVVAGAGAGAAPHVVVFDGTRRISSFFAYEEQFLGGVRVASLDLTMNGIDDVLAGAGPGAGPHALGIDSATLAGKPSFFAFNPGFRGGIFVAGTIFKADETLGGRNHKGFAITKVSITTPGRHEDRPICPAQAPSDEGAFADCAGGTCNGNQRFCANFVEKDFLKPSDQVLVDLYVTPESGSRTQAACREGYEQAGTATNCFNGTCSGEQVFCARYLTKSAISAQDKFVGAAGFRLTGKPTVGGEGCRAGYEEKGSVADCRFGKCFGNQPLCVSSQKGL